jgi:GxxExxY protein
MRKTDGQFCAFCCVKSNLEKNLGAKTQKEQVWIRIAVGLSQSHRFDRLVEDPITIEVKAVEDLMPIHKVQLFTYFRFASFASLCWMSLAPATPA